MAGEGDSKARGIRSGEGEKFGKALASMDPWKTLGYTVSGLAKYLTRADASLERFSWVVSDRPVGVVCVRYPWLRGPFVEMLAVLPGEQGRGVGRDVLSWVEGNSRWSGGNVWVTVSAFNGRARDFYLQCGYEEVGRLPCLIAANQDEILLRKMLGKSPEGD
jgi:GNAT superfamily N-acetyltransferase